MTFKPTSDMLYHGQLIRFLRCSGTEARTNALIIALIGLSMLSSILTCLAHSEPTSTENPVDLSPVQLEISATPRATQPNTPTSPVIPIIATSRPSAVDSSTTVPRGSLQSESGVTYLDNNDATRSWILPESLLRLGLTDNTEFRFNAPNYLHISGPPSSNNTTPGSKPLHSGANNFGDIQFGFSHHFNVPGNINVALIPLLNIPTGSPAVTSGGVDPEFRIAASRILTEKLSIGSQLNTRWSTNSSAPSALAFTPAVVAYYYFKPTIGTFLEYAATIPNKGPSNHILQMGVLYVVKRRHQLDARIGTGLTRNSPDLMFGFGYSFRIDGLF